jgi:excisionase family DNA binding protein
MNQKQLETLARLATESGLIREFKTVFDRSFTTTIHEGADGKVHLVATEADSMSDNMTVSDMAAILQTDRRTIRRMTEARQQRTQRHPIPFFKVNGKLLRFRRDKITEWLQTMANEKPVFPPQKRKRS